MTYDAFSKLTLRVATWLEKHPVIVLVVISLTYFAITMRFAHEKLLWDDEFFTLYISYAGYSGIWEALSTGADQHPPSFYWITFTLVNLFGYSDVALRGPAIFGYWLLLISLYGVIARRWTNLLGFSAFLIPVATATYWWAYDARGYGMLLGCAAAAYFFWELSIERKFRTLAVLLFGFFLTLAVGSHYYGVLILGPFALGTAYMMYRSGRLDIPLTSAHFAPILLLIAFFPVIQRARGYSDNFWARPQISSIEETIFTVFNSAGLMIFLLFLLVFLFSMVGNRQIHVSEADYSDPSEQAKVLTVLGFCAIPLVGYLIGEFVTNAFNPRYAITSTVGVVCIVIGALAFISKKSPNMQLAILLVIVLGIGMKLPKLQEEIDHSKEDYNSTIEVIEKYVNRGLPMAISEVTIFHRMAYYAPDRLKSRISYLSNPEASVRWIGHDTIDRGLIDLSKWFHAGTVPYRSFLEKNESFYLYGYIGDWTWLTYQLVEDGFQLTVLERHGSRLVMRADRRMPLPN